MDKSRLLIVKENRDYCRELGEFLSSTGMFEALPPVHDGAEAVKRILELSPDILLMDVILPNMDGMDVLRRVRMSGEQDMKVIVLSAFVDDMIAGMLQNLGASYIIHMPATHQTILSRILDFAVQDQQVKELARAFKAQSSLAYRDELVTRYLRNLGVPVNLSGYQQLKTAIAFTIEQGNRQIRVTREVYEHVALVHGTTPKRVERNIRTAIEAAWERGDIKAQHKYFGYTVHQNKGRPTNKEFIAMIADQVRMRLRQ